MVRLTLAFWAGIYLLFTLRAIVKPHPYFLAQAGLRAVMMLVGMSLCAALYLMLNRLDAEAVRSRLAAILPLTAAATIAYVCINYFMFYEVLGLWEPPRGALAIIGGYLIELIWVFAAWVLLYLHARRRHGRAVPGAAPEALRHLWVKQRDAQVCVPVERIEWIEAEGDYVRIRTPAGSYLMRSTMRAMEDALDDERFVRIHRRIIVPIPLVEAIERHPGSRVQLRLRTGASFPVGRHYRRRLDEIRATA